MHTARLNSQQVGYYSRRKSSFHRLPRFKKLINFEEFNTGSPQEYCRNFKARESIRFPLSQVMSKNLLMGVTGIINCTLCEMCIFFPAVNCGTHALSSSRLLTCNGYWLDIHSFNFATLLGYTSCHSGGSSADQKLGIEPDRASKRALRMVWNRFSPPPCSTSRTAAAPSGPMNGVHNKIYSSKLKVSSTRPLFPVLSFRNSGCEPN
jgi:hypothetical protein